MDIIDKIKVEQLHSTLATWRHKKDLDSYLEFRTVYWEALNRIDENADDRFRNAIVEFSAQLFSVSRDFRQDLPKWISDKVVVFFSSELNLSDLLNLENGENALAWFCCDRAASYVYPDKISHEHQFRTILMHWTDSNYMLGRPTLDKVVTLIYGHACWQLYGTQLDEDMDPLDVSNIVQEITRANLPFAFRKSFVIKTELNQNLPDSFI